MLDKFKANKAAKQFEFERANKVRLLASLADGARKAHEAWDFAKLDVKPEDVPGVKLKKGELAYLVIDGVGLVEPRREPGHWAGRSQGYSFRIAKGVSYRVGTNRGTYVQGDEKPTVIDTGLGVITDRRMLFVGSKRSVEWDFEKLLGYSLEADGMAIFSVSNRQKSSGFAYQPEVDHKVDAVVSAALAKHDGPDEHAAVMSELLGMYTEALSMHDALAAELARPIGT